MFDIFVGVDPSINSTGVCVLVYEGDIQLDEHFFIIKPDKLTKKEQAAEEKYAKEFEYMLYDKLVVEKDSNNTLAELCKTKNFIKICNFVKEIINKYRIKYQGMTRFHVCQEGISYGSKNKTKSIFDLAGLNFMLRWTAIGIYDADLTIGTPSEIKKFASGNGNCNKDIMISLFKASHFGFDLPKLDDIADAYWMAKYAKYIVEI